MKRAALRNQQHYKNSGYTTRRVTGKIYGRISEKEIHRERKLLFRLSEETYLEGNKMGTERSPIIANEKIEIRFNWDAYPKQRSLGLIGGLMAESTAVDCDACAIFCDRKGKPLSAQVKESCLSYDNASMFDGAARHKGDNRTGAGSDDETIILDLNALPAEVGAIVFTMDLFKERKQSTLGKIQNTFVRIIGTGNTGEITRYDFNNLGSNRKLVVCGTLKRESSGWAFLPPRQETLNVSSMDEFIRGL